MFSLVFGILFFIFRFRYRAIIPVVIMTLLGIALIFIFDAERGNRVIELLFATIRGDGIFRGPILGSLLKLTFYWLTAFLAIRVFHKYKKALGGFDRAFIQACIAVLILIPIPLYDGQFLDRLSNFLFLPQCILLLYFDGFLKKRARQTITAVLLLIGTASLGGSIWFRPPPEVPDEAFSELKKIRIQDNETTIIIARHNLEFWVAWSLRTKVAQESELNTALFEEYEHVLLLNQVKGKQRSQRKPRGPSNPFNEPDIPEGAELLKQTEHFTIYEVDIEDIE